MGDARLAGPHGRELCKQDVGDRTKQDGIRPSEAVTQSDAARSVLDGRGAAGTVCNSRMRRLMKSCEVVAIAESDRTESVELSSRRVVFCIGFKSERV